MPKCQYCGLEIYDYVNVGIGSVPVAVTCCERQELDFHWNELGWRTKVRYWLSYGPLGVPMYALARVKWAVHDAIAYVRSIGRCEICGRRRPRRWTYYDTGQGESGTGNICTGCFDKHNEVPF